MRITQSCLRLTVAQKATNYGKGNPLTHRNAGGGMPKVMNSGIRYTSFFTDFCPRLSYVVDWHTL